GGSGQVARDRGREVRMKRFITVGFVFALLVVAVGCSGSAPTPPPAAPLMKGEAQVQELLKLEKEAAEAAGKDPAKALEYQPKIMEAAKKFADLKLSEADIKALVEKYPDLEKGSGLGKDKMRGEAEIKELIKLQKEAEEAATKDPMKALELLPKILEVTKKLEALKLTPEEMKALTAKYPELGKGPGPGPGKDKKDLDKK